MAEWINGIEYEGSRAVNALPDIESAVLRPGTTETAALAFSHCKKTKKRHNPSRR